MEWSKSWRTDELSRDKNPGGVLKKTSVNVVVLMTLYTFAYTVQFC